MRKETAVKWRTKYPELPTLKLARMMYKDDGAYFSSVEDARAALRYIEGKKGEESRKKSRNLPTIKKEHRPFNPYNLPASDETTYEPFVMKHKKIAIFSDIHAPYHNIEALSKAIETATLEKCDAVLINGDLFDFHGLSRFNRDPKKKNFAQELQIGADIILTIEKICKCPVYLKIGNHEDRYQHYLWMKAGELAGVEDFELKNLLAKRCRVTVIDDKRIIKMGDLCCVHGHEFGGSVFSPVNIARGFYLRAKASTIGGHHHRSSEHTEQDINGKIVTTWSVGCLSELHPMYLPINSWNHGFAIVEVDGSDFHVRNYRIYKGKVL